MIPELNTTHLKLREVALADGPALQNFQNSPEQWEQQAIEPEELADCQLRVERYFQHRGEGDQRRLFVFVAELNSTGEIIGNGSLSRSHPVIANMGFGMSKEHCKKGYATEIANALLKFGFQDLKLHRVEADVAVQNVACARVLKKVGMQHEGTIREGIWAQGKWWTEDKYSVLSSD